MRILLLSAFFFFLRSWLFQIGQYLLSVDVMRIAIVMLRNRYYEIQNSTTISNAFFVVFRTELALNQTLLHFTFYCKTPSSASHLVVSFKIQINNNSITRSFYSITSHYFYLPYLRRPCSIQ